MSSNIRVWTVDSSESFDSPKRWDNHRSALAAMYKDIQPDIIGTQEVYLSQWNCIKDQLAPLGYDCVSKFMSGRILLQQRGEEAHEAFRDA